jgi:hypothetical protein
MPAYTRPGHYACHIGQPTAVTVGGARMSLTSDRAPDQRTQVSVTRSICMAIVA